MSVSVHQAAANAFAGWLGTKLTGVTVEPRWPSPDKKLPAKAITLVCAGPRHDEPIDIRALSYANQGDHQTRAIWQVAACQQPVQLDVWAHTDVDRDDILAQLDTLLRAGSTAIPGIYNPNPVGQGVLVALADGWDEMGTTADFVFEGPELLDEPMTPNRADYRATYRGDAYVMLAIPAVSARQKTLSFKMKLSETDSYDTYPVT